MPLKFSLAALLLAAGGVGIVYQAHVPSGARLIDSQPGLDAKAPFINVRAAPYFAVGDGVADDTAAIQAAITAAIAAGRSVYVPAGIYLISSTLTLNTTTSGVTMVGEGGHNTPTRTIFRYTGSGSAMKAINNGGAGVVFSLILRRLAVQPGNSQNASIGFDITQCSECTFDDVGVFSSTSNGKQFTTGWQCATNCNIIEWNAPTVENTTTAFYVTGGSALWFHQGNFFQNTTVFKFDGVGAHVVIKDNWFEFQDFSIVFDDTAIATNYDYALINGNRFLYNSLYANATTLTFTNTVAKSLLNSNLYFENNSVDCTNPLCPNTYPIKFASAGANSQISLWVRANDFYGATGGIVTSNNAGSNVLYVHDINNYSVDKAFAALPTDLSVTASSTWSSQKQNNLGWTELSGSAFLQKWTDGSGVSKATMSTAGVLAAVQMSTSSSGSSFAGSNSSVGAFTGGSLISNSSLALTATLFANLGTPSNGVSFYCSDCVVAPTCAGSGTGAIATRLNGAWNCNGGGPSNKGTITLSTGSGTATVLSGANCVCSDTTANASVKCAVATTTLTATGTGSDVIAYHCF